MSIIASNWVWELNLPPSEKIVLLWLAHVANTNNASWYGVSKIARQCNISCRTTQRAIASLIKSGHLITKRRVKLDGSYDSNMYVLPIKEGTDKLTPRGVKAVTTSCQIVQLGGVTGVILNTSRNIIETTNNIECTKTPNLVYPILESVELNQIKNILKNTDASLTQLYLDELAGCYKSGRIKKSPSAYLNGILKRASLGLFTPSSRGEQIAKARLSKLVSKSHDYGNREVIKQGLANMHQVLKRNN